MRAGTADVLLVDGRVFVGGDPRGSEALPAGSRDGPPRGGTPDAVAILGGRIAWVGRAADATPWRGPATEVIDARGGLIAPGFEDAHLHFRMGAVSLLQVDLQPAESVADLGRILGGWRRSHQDAEWIIGRGWHYGVFPSGMPDRGLLDELVPDRPAVLECFDGHTHWLNSAALARAGITDETPDPPHGTIERDAVTGEPTGILKEFAHELLAGVMPRPSDGKIEAAMRDGIALAQRHGLTSVQEAWTEVDDLHRYARMRADEPPGLRFRVALPADPVEWHGGIDAGRRAWGERLAAYAAEVEALGADEWLRGGIVKAFADGVIESRTAWMLAPYEDADPEVSSGSDANASSGRPNWTAEALTEMTSMAVARGWQVQIHAIGDAAINAALDAHESARSLRARDPRGRIEHVEWPDPADVPRFAALGVIASMQPSHASPVPHKAAVRERQIGRRTEHGWPWASILHAGGPVAFGSDWPIASFDPRSHLHAAVTRTDPHGAPAGGWIPGERLSVAEALACYTWGSAYAARAERSRGTVVRGLAADLVILDRDLLAEGASAIQETRVVATICGGRVVYRAG